MVMKPAHMNTCIQNWGNRQQLTSRLPANAYLYQQVAFIVLLLLQAHAWKCNESTSHVMYAKAATALCNTCGESYTDGEAEPHVQLATPWSQGRGQSSELVHGEQ